MALLVKTTDTDYIKPDDDQVSVIITPNHDLGEPNIYKYLNYLDVDYIGHGTIYLYGDGYLIQKIETNYINNVTKVHERFYIKLENRFPFVKFMMVVLKRVSEDLSSFTLYGIEIDFDIAKRY
jgi:hypothetical protein